MALTDLEKVDFVELADDIKIIKSLLANAKPIEVPKTNQELCKEANISYPTFMKFQPKLTIYWAGNKKRFLLTDLIEAMKTKP